MLSAGRVSTDDVLARLASLRPVFHSEADFQQAFAWEIRSLDPQYECVWRRVRSRVSGSICC
jgi:hypothetical protein